MFTLEPGTRTFIEIAVPCVESVTLAAAVVHPAVEAPLGRRSLHEDGAIGEMVAAIVLDGLGPVDAGAQAHGYSAELMFSDVASQGG